MKIKQIIDNKWDFSDTTLGLIIGDSVEFSCNGHGRGGHYHVSGTVTKVNKVTFNVTEAPNSHNPGTLWNIRKDRESLYLRR